MPAASSIGPTWPSKAWLAGEPHHCRAQPGCSRTSSRCAGRPLSGPSREAARARLLVAPAPHVAADPGRAVLRGGAGRRRAPASRGVPRGARPTACARQGPGGRARVAAGVRGAAGARSALTSRPATRRVTVTVCGLMEIGLGWHLPEHYAPPNQPQQSPRSRAAALARPDDGCETRGSWQRRRAARARSSRHSASVACCPRIERRCSEAAGRLT